MKITVNDQQLQTIRRVLEMDLGHARDAVARAEMQQARMPFDHDNSDALDRYRNWKLSTEQALWAVNGVES
jgi:hypothetical protein